MRPAGTPAHRATVGWLADDTAAGDNTWRNYRKDLLNGATITSTAGRNVWDALSGRRTLIESIAFEPVLNEPANIQIRIQAARGSFGTLTTLWTSATFTPSTFERTLLQVGVSTLPDDLVTVSLFVPTGSVAPRGHHVNISYAPLE